MSIKNVLDLVDSEKSLFSSLARRSMKKTKQK